MPPKPRFIDGEKVLCFHGPLLYEAKCLRSQLQDKHMQYFIHYSGWNKNWDEWVPDSRVLKYNEANLQKQKELVKTHMKTKKARGAKVTVKSEKETPLQVSPGEKSKPKLEKVLTPCTSNAKPKSEKVLTPCTSNAKPKSEKVPTPCITPIPDTSSISESPRETKKKKPEALFEDEIEPEREIRLDIPPLLKEWLIDDNDLITRQKKLLHLPARITVDHIIAGYVKEKVSAKGLTQTMERSIVLFSNNVREFFNVSLGKMLLHKFERPQYGEMLAENPGWSMCQIYGTIHLLRLFTLMGSMLTDLPMRGDKMTTLVTQLLDFMRYISENPSFFSLKDYEVASPEYHRRAL